MYKSVSRNLALVVRALVLLASCLPFIMASLSAAQVAVNVDATANPHPISPLVYGVAFGSAAQLPVFFTQQLQITLHILQLQQLFLESRNMRFRRPEFLVFHEAQYSAGAGLV